MKPPSDADALDAYSAVVTRVAAKLTPHVASLQIGRGSGSAVVFTGDGYLLTNAHVVRDQYSGTALFSDGTQARVDVVGTDPLSDLAVVRSSSTTPGPAVLGDADQLRVGQLVVAVGSPPGWPAR